MLLTLADPSNAPIAHVIRHPPIFHPILCILQDSNRTSTSKALSFAANKFGEMSWPLTAGNKNVASLHRTPSPLAWRHWKGDGNGPLKPGMRLRQDDFATHKWFVRDRYQIIACCYETIALHISSCGTKCSGKNATRWRVESTVES